jgi:hypothetical protein
MNGTGGGPSKPPAELKIVDCTELEKRLLDITNANLLVEGIAEAKRFGAGQLQTPSAQPIQHPATIEFPTYLEDVSSEVECDSVISRPSTSKNTRISAATPKEHNKPKNRANDAIDKQFANINQVYSDILIQLQEQNKLQKQQIENTQKQYEENKKLKKEKIRISEMALDLKRRKLEILEKRYCFSEEAEYLQPDYQ